MDEITDELLREYGTHTFISYSRRQIEYAQKLEQKLRAEGFAIWIDLYKLRTGVNWSKALIDAVKICDAMIVLVSDDAIASEWVNKEVDLAIREGKPILPLSLNGRVWEKLAHIHHYFVDVDELPRESFFGDLGGYASRQNLKNADKIWIEVLLSLSERNQREVDDGIISTLVAIGEKAIPQLIRAMDSDSVGRRSIAYISLTYLGKAAVPYLIPALDHPNNWVRNQAAKMLGNIGDYTALNPLVEHLGSTNGGNVANAISRMGSAAFDLVVPKLKDDNKKVVRHACWVLEDLGDARAIPFLEEVLPGETDLVKKTITETIAKLKRAE